jgi:hypothetical protein
MKRFWLVSIGFFALAIPATVLANGGNGGFDGVVHSIESRYNVRATRIPFLGLISFFSKTATHGAVAGMRVATIESFDDDIDGNELNRIVEQKLGAGWERMIRETSRKGHEQTLIFTHPEGARMGLFIVNLDGNEMNLVQVSVDPKHLDDDLGQYSHHHHDGNDDDAKGSDESN